MFPFINQPFIYNPFVWNRNIRRYPLLDRTIPKIVTTGVTDTDTSTTLSICPTVWCQLPKEGVIVFEALHTPAAASANLPLAISVSGSVSSTSTSGKVPLVRADSSQAVGSDITAGNRYWIYYNKCDGVMQIMNYYPTTTCAS